jgi:hypothetical protein
VISDDYKLVYKPMVINIKQMKVDFLFCNDIYLPMSLIGFLEVSQDHQTFHTIGKHVLS